MKKLALIIILVSMFLFIGCGRDGKDGEAYLSFTWAWEVDTYTDDNPAIPYVIVEKTEYQVNIGTYSYSCNCSDGAGEYWGYEGTYKITIHEGKSGGFITDGDNGKDNHYKLSLFDSWGMCRILPKTINTNKCKKNKLMRDSGIDLSLYTKIKVGEVKTEIFESENGRMIVTQQKFLWVKK